MKTIYCLSGLGADEHLFQKLTWPEADIHFLHWIKPNDQESIVGYAKRLGEQITDRDAVLVGVSFGGIMCLEIARQLSIKKVILISSVQGDHQLPGWMKRAGQWNAARVISPGSLTVA